MTATIRDRVRAGGLRQTTVTVALVALLIGAGCASTPSLSVADYADAASASTEAYVAEGQQLSLTYQKTVEREVSDIVASGSETAIAEATTLVRTETVNYLALLDDAILRYIASIDALVPPDAIKDAHDSYLAVVESVESTVPGMREAVGNAMSIDEIQTALIGSGFSDGQAAWVAMCGALEQTVRNEGHGIDLKCLKREVVVGEGTAP